MGFLLLFRLKNIGWSGEMDCEVWENFGNSFGNDECWETCEEMMNR